MTLLVDGERLTGAYAGCAVPFPSPGRARCTRHGTVDYRRDEVRLDVHHQSGGSLQVVDGADIEGTGGEAAGQPSGPPAQRDPVSMATTSRSA